MKTYDVILHPTDFSAESEQAFFLACSIARDQFAELVVVHVLSPSELPPGVPECQLLEEDSAAVRECRKNFHHLRSLAGDIPLSFRISVGYSVGSILNVAREEQADLIVIASHQRSQFLSQLHGSVADGVLRQSHCPVLWLRQPGPTAMLASSKARDAMKALH